MYKQNVPLNQRTLAFFRLLVISLPVISPAIKGGVHLSPVTQIYDEEVQRISTYTNMEEVAAKLPTFPSLKSSLYRNHRVRLPVLPQSREDVVFEGEWAQTMSGAPFLLASEGAEDKIVIFATRENLELLSAADTVGTFRVCPRLFYQVFTLHIFRHGQQFPVVYFLLPRKARETYNKAFTMLKEAAQNFGLDIVPNKVMTDFESGLVQAIQISFPTAEILGCFYHFAQSVWRKVQELGLQLMYNDPQDASLRSFVRKAVALAFVPCAFLRIAWDTIKLEAPDFEAVDRLTVYFEVNWIQRRGPQKWNHYHNEEQRTNNHVEGWHSRLQKINRGQIRKSSLGGEIRCLCFRWVPAVRHFDLRRTFGVGDWQRMRAL